MSDSLSDIVKLERREREQQTLSECQFFAQTVLCIVDDIQKQGSTKHTLPKFPKSNLLEIMGKTKKTHTLSTHNLNVYLKNKLMCYSGQQPIHIPTPADVQYLNYNSLEHTIQAVAEAYQLVKRENAKALRSSLIYGMWLDVLYDRFKQDKSAGVVNTWEKLLKNSIGISAGYARQLRILSKKFLPYPKLWYVSISLSELWNKREEIEDMLTTHTEIADFWKEMPNYTI